MTATQAIITTVASTAALYVAACFGPPGAAAAFVVLPLPTLVLGALGGTGAVAVATVFTTLLLLSMLGVQGAALWLGLVGLPGMMTVWALRREIPIEGVIGIAVTVFAACAAALLWVTFGSMDELYTSLAAAWQQGFEGAMTLYRDLGISADQLNEINSGRDEFVTGLVSVMPAMTLVAGGALWLINVWVASRWVAWPQANDFKRWQAPAELIWAFIAAGFAMFAPIPGVALAARNIFIVLLACYFCQGLAIVNYFLHRFGFPRGLRIASYLLIGLQQMVAGAVLVLGLFDLWGDFRRLHPVDAPAESDSE